MPNEQEQFLKDLDIKPPQDDILEQPLNPQEPAKDPVDPAVDPEETDAEGLKPRNRRERRLMSKLQEERESSMFLAGKLEAREEAKRSLSEEREYLKGVERIYGTDSPEAQLATDLLKKALVGMAEDAENRAFERMQESRRKELEEESKAERELDDIVEELEDDHNVTLTETQRTSFFKLLERMSPKDEAGHVKEYADPDAVWEVFKDRLSSRRSPESTRAKDLSARAMVQSGAPKDNDLGDANERYLREHGII
jgi:hypothetical protein